MANNTFQGDRRALFESEFSESRIKNTISLNVLCAATFCALNATLKAKRIVI